MAKSNLFIGVVTVKLKAPEGYKPRTTTKKVGYISSSNSESFRSQTATDIGTEVKNRLETANPGVTLTFSTTIEATAVDGLKEFLK